MIPGQFDYVRPGNLDETLRILKDREGEAKLLSGGYSLLPLIKLRLAQPGLLVDLRDVTGLDGIVETDDYLVIGARATHRQIHEAPVIRDTYLLLHDVTATIGDPQVRNWGTIGGSVAHADPASDWPAVLHRRQRHASSAGARPATATIAARDFFIDTFQTAIEPTEVLTEIRIAAPTARAGRRLREARAKGRRLRHRRRRGDRPARRGRPDRAIRDRPDRRRRDAVRGDRCRGRPRRQRPLGRPLPPGRRGGRSPEPARGRRPRTGRVQAGDGRGADPQGAPPGHRTRARVRVGGR